MPKTFPRRKLLLFALAGVAVLAMAWVLVSTTLLGRSGGSGSGHWSSGTDLDSRLSAMEQRQQEQFNQLDRRLDLLMSRMASQGLAPTPEQIAARAEATAQRKRLRTDPAFRRQQEMQRLNGLQQDFTKEPVDQRWSTTAHAQIADVLAAATTSSKVKLRDKDIQCRSSTCKITLDLDTGSDVDDLMMYMTTDMAELLPRTKMVTLPSADGKTQQISIYASARSPNNNDGPRD